MLSKCSCLYGYHGATITTYLKQEEEEEDDDDDVDDDDKGYQRISLEEEFEFELREIGLRAVKMIS